MNVKLEDRPIEQVKEEVIDILVYNYSHSVISSEAFERRLDVVITSTSHQEMMAQVEDLQPSPDDTVKKHKEEAFAVNYATEGAQATETLINVLGESDRSGVWTVPRELKIYTFLGSSVLDFTNARFSSPHVTIKIVSILGGDKVYVPENINIVSKAFCILGSVKNRAPSIASNQAPTITIEGVVLLSELSIKIKTTMKESFVAFANKMKTMFDSNQGM
ncbi:DUF1707 and DUF2154 domain-containing protein [Glaciecola sp. XM2]|uniref:LiaF domain-containing protein n=1 Tax=Glaciecola sp. XM2 TaxID=1914931 RepID=UPI001BDE028E|nr:LiaF domain-containing protein [Glaciecola sp. XM2]MBT1451284.1 DUF1707 and DUF2154 domain-containing protein [Glaciecola sp. XM2]